MKRRGTGRRQVLELDANSSSSKASWQTKYQQICLEHVGSSSPTPVVQNGSEVEDTKLPQLVGYNSDSEDEEEKGTSDLESKVDDFLKEISDITSGEPATNEESVALLSSDSATEKSKPSVGTEKSKTTKKTKRKVKPQEFGPSPLGEQVNVADSSSLQPTIAWQECYDESSGCYYYWNTETNEVTWDMPQEVRAYQVALEQWNARQLLHPQQVSATTGLVSISTKQPHNVPVNQQQPNKKLGLNKPQEKVKNKRTKPNSDSEDEKIELITSYGPTSDDEELDTALATLHSSKKKKTDQSKSSSKKAAKEVLSIGPQLPPGYILPEDKKEPEFKPTVTKEVKSSTLNRQQVAVQKPQSETPTVTPKTDVVDVKRDDPVNIESDKQKISALQRLKTLKNRDSEDSTDSSDSEYSDSSKEDNIKKENEKGKEDTLNEEEDDDVEDSILERLKNQAKILQELGGEIPDEIKELISKSTLGECFSPEKPKDSRGDAPIFDIPEESEVSEKCKQIEAAPIYEDLNEKHATSTAVVTDQPVVQNDTSKGDNVVKNTILTETTEVKVENDSEKKKNLIVVDDNTEEIMIEVVKDTQENSISNKDNKIENGTTVILVENGIVTPANGNEVENLDKDIQVNPDLNHIETEPIVNHLKMEDVDNDIIIEPVVTNMKESIINNVIEPAVKEKKIKPVRSDVTKEAIITVNEKAPNSFSLIAGYGNEEDSEAEEDKVDDILKGNEKPSPLFPIVEAEKEKLLHKNKKIIKLSAKAKELIHSSTTTEKARATDFISTVDGLRPSGSVTKESEDMPMADIRHDFIEPVKKVSRKKRLEMPAIGLIKQPKSAVSKPRELNVEHVENKEKENGVKVLAEKSEAVVDNTYISGGYNNAWTYNSELRGGEYRGFGYGHDCNREQLAATTSKSGMIQFIKAETLMPKNVPVDDKPNEESIIKEEELKNTELDRANELAQVISEKVKFLCEGKETVPPVQVMAIQLETLTTAMAGGGLSSTYMLGWLQSVDTQLASLEQAAAPLGWQCHWDRMYKRYFYRNDETGDTQWDYPSEPPTQGGVEAMELCDSPPPPTPITAPLPPPPPVSPPHTPPPPRISSRTPSPVMPESDEAPIPPPPPIISDQPPLPPLPPPTPPPPPPPPIISSLVHGEPLPPGVDMPEEMYDNQLPPLPTESSESIYSVGYEVPVPYDPFQVQPITDYNGSVYNTGAVFSTVEEAYVIARPPASAPVPPEPSTQCLASELDSFYNEVAALEPPPPPPAAPSPPPPSSPPPAQPTEPLKKKKKTKLTPGLALKKRGVPSLVAKWQQVQQDVRREEENEKT